MKYILISFVSFFILSSLNASVQCSPELIDAVTAIQSTSKGKKLIESVDSLTIVYADLPNHPFAALWDGNTRTIYVNGTHKPAYGNIISSIVFELHNAQCANELNHYYEQAAQGILTKEAFVVAVERMEHRNTLATAALLKEGIEAGIFPAKAYWPALQDFDTHYKIQQLFDHSQWIAERYNQTNPNGRFQVYRGTIGDLQFLDKSDKHDLAFYLGIRDNILNNSDFKDQYLEKLKVEYSVVTERKAELLERTFGADFRHDPMLFASAHTNALQRG